VFEVEVKCNTKVGLGNKKEELAHRLFGFAKRAEWSPSQGRKILGFVSVY
jgi:hypothetical protein